MGAAIANRPQVPPQWTPHLVSEIVKSTLLRMSSKMRQSPGLITFSRSRTPCSCSAMAAECHGVCSAAAGTLRGCAEIQVASVLQQSDPKNQTEMK